jgi:SEC-C motif
MKETGRNDPCPCGSGRKYKYCCLPFPPKGGDSGPGAPPLGHGGLDLSQLGIGSPGFGILDPYDPDVGGPEPGASFGSFEEMREQLGAFIESQNDAPEPDFHGLSPTQVHDIIYHPFDSPRMVSFRERLSFEPEAELILILDEIRKAIESPAGLKATQTGALPRSFAKHMKPLLAPYSEIFDLLPDIKVNKEGDLFDLHVGRMILKVSGLLRTYKGKFILSRNCRDLLKNGQFAAVYPVLFRSMATRFNWGYWDLFPDVSPVQSFFAFGLYLLSKYGREPRPAEFYVDAFIDAFPMLVFEIPPSPYDTDPIDEFMHLFITRVIKRVWVFFGLASMTSKRREPYGFEHTIMATPLLYDFVSFPVLRK